MTSARNQDPNDGTGDHLSTRNSGGRGPEALNTSGRRRRLEAAGPWPREAGVGPQQREQHVPAIDFYSKCTEPVSFQTGARWSELRFTKMVRFAGRIRTGSPNAGRVPGNCIDIPGNGGAEWERVGGGRDVHSGKSQVDNVFISHRGLQRATPAPGAQ